MTARVLAVLGCLVLLAACDAKRPVDAERERRRAEWSAEQARDKVWVIAHPGNPMILYVTTLPRQENVDSHPKAQRLAVLDLASGQWRDVDLAEELRTRLGLVNPRLYFEIGGHANVAVSRD